MSFLSSKPSDSNFTVALHPLVLLTVSDQITRQEIRGQNTPVVGAILGQQKGREITAEHAFPASVIQDKTGAWVLNREWMERRIEQYKDVHKATALDVIGWYTLCPETGPPQPLVAIQKQMVQITENAILLAIHPEAVASTEAVKGNEKSLPLSVYESVAATKPIKDEGSMQVDGEENESFEFRKLPYTIETEETEMIAIDYIAKGSGSAVAIAEEERPPSPSIAERTEKKGKKRADAPAEGEKPSNGVKESTNPLMPEEEDQIASITTRMNSVRMLQSRLSSLSHFLQSQPPSYLSDSNIALTAGSPDPAQLPHLRNIQALLTRLALLTPAGDLASDSSDPLTTASQSQANDVALSTLLSLLGQNVQGISEMGRKASTVEQSKILRNRNKGALGRGDGVFGADPIPEWGPPGAMLGAQAG